MPTKLEKQCLKHMLSSTAVKLSFFFGQQQLVYIECVIDI